METMSIRDDVRRLGAYRFEARPADVKLDQNEAPLDLPEALRARALERIADAEFHRYPSIHANELRAAIARLEGWDEEGVVVAGGSNVLIQAFAIATAIGRRVLTVRPTFSVYRLQAQIVGASLTEVPLLESFALPTERLIGELEDGAGVVFLANPAAPTGNRHPDEAVARVVAAADPERWTVVLDEAYWQFAGRDHADLVRAHPHAVSLRTMSKAFGLGGVRLGYALGAPDVVRHVQKVVLPFSVSALQLAVGLTVAEAPEVARDRVASIVRERSRIESRLDELDAVQVFPSQTNFLLIRVEAPGAVFAGLTDRGVRVRLQHGAPGLDGCLRVSVGLPEENDRFLAALAETLDEVSVHA